MPKREGDVQLTQNALYQIGTASALGRVYRLVGSTLVDQTVPHPSGRYDLLMFGSDIRDGYGQLCGQAADLELVAPEHLVTLQVAQRMTS